MGDHPRCDVSVATGADVAVIGFDGVSAVVTSLFTH